MNRAFISIVIYIALSSLACMAHEYSAHYQVPGSTIVIGVALHQHNPPLAEYHRSVFIVNGGKGRKEAEIEPSDTGGRCLVNLYRKSDAIYTLAVDGRYGKDVDLRRWAIANRSEFQPPLDSPPTEYVGAFDFDTRGDWRFFNAGEHEEEDTTTLHPHE